jgi:predicted MFS family arabinose efflux permease
LSPGDGAPRRAEGVLPFGNFATGDFATGNFAPGCGAMVAPGTLNDRGRSLQVSAAIGGQLVAGAAASMALGAPPLASAVGVRDRRAVPALAFWFGVFGLAGEVLVSRSTDRRGANPLVAGLLALMPVSFVLRPLALPLSIGAARRMRSAAP